MKLDNFVPFGRPQSGTVIIKLITEFEVSNRQIPGTALPKPFKKQSNAPIFMSIITCNNADILKIYYGHVLKMSYFGTFVKHTLCSLY